MTKKQAKKILALLISLLVMAVMAFGLIFFIIRYGDLDDKEEAAEVISVVTTEAASTTENMQFTEIATTEEPTESPEEILDRQIDGLIDEMTIEEKVGQMFFVRTDALYDRSMFDTYNPGGIILFGSDVEDKTVSGLQEYIDDFQSLSKYPLFIGIDEEGGTVTRISYNYNLTRDAFKSPRELYEQGGYDAVIDDSHNKSELLKSFGINVNFAPVVDYSTDYRDFMYDRAFGDNIDETCEFADKIVTAMKEEKMGCVLKHFPGYGNNGDTHTGVVTDLRDYDVFENQDFLPFEAGIKAGADCVLVCHNIVACMDDECPASLSEKVHRILRDDLDFDGVIITDDLAMSGVADYVSADAAAVQAVQAGNDMMIVSDYVAQYDAVLAAVKNGDIDEQQIDDSVRRILKWKYNLGLLEDLGTY
ncbi:MAG: glycoside hydrolase family 3 protein [Coprococcus sp.]